MPHKNSKQPSPEGKPKHVIEIGNMGFNQDLYNKDVIACHAVAFEWAESFDSKDWDRLSSCVASSLYVRR